METIGMVAGSMASLLFVMAQVPMLVKAQRSKDVAFSYST